MGKLRRGRTSSERGVWELKRDQRERKSGRRDVAMTTGTELPNGGQEVGGKGGRSCYPLSSSSKKGQIRSRIPETRGSGRLGGGKTGPALVSCGANFVERWGKERGNKERFPVRSTETKDEETDLLEASWGRGHPPTRRKTLA